MFIFTAALEEASTATLEESSAIVSFFHSITLEKLIPTLVIFLAGLLAIRLLMGLFDKLLHRSKLEKAAYSLIRAVTRGLLYLILILTILSQLGVDVSSLVAILSVVSLAVSLAVQGALTNLVGGFSLLSTHPFKAGDYVDIGDQSGTVCEVGLAYTKLKTSDNKIISIPNGTAASCQIVNYSTADTRRIEITISASYDAPTEDVKSALLRAANISLTLFSPEPFAGIQSYGDSAIVYVLRVWCATENYWNAFYTINENIRKEFSENGISMTYPHLNVHMDQGCKQ